MDWPWKREKPQTAAVTVNAPKTIDAGIARLLRESSEAWRIYRQVGEIHYAVTQQARLVGRLDWFIDDESDEQGILERAFGSSLRKLQTTAAISMQVAGAFALARVANEWKILAYPLSNEAKKQAKIADVLVTSENMDPQLGTPDSPVISAIPVATELLLSRAQARATARSRTAQLLTVLYPKEGAGNNPEEFEQSIAQVMLAPLVDEKSSSVAVPNIIGWPKDSINDWQTLDLTGPIDEKLDDRIDRLVQQLAIILDIPPSVLLGTSDENHWTSWQNAEDNFLSHVEPLAAPIGDALAEAIRQMIGTELTITPDPAPLLRRRPTVTDVLAAHQQGVVSAEWAREQIGAPEDEAGTGVPEPTVEVVEGERASEPRTAAVSRALDGNRLNDINYQANTSFDDLIQDVSDRILERLGAVIRSVAQGRDIDLPDVSNRELVQHYDGVIPNYEQIIRDEAEKAGPRVERIIRRAYGRLRALGVPLEPEDSELSDAQEAFASSINETVSAKSEGKPAEEQSWSGAKVIAAAAAGVGIATILQGATEADPNAGIATGPRVIRNLQEQGLHTTGRYVWDHQYQGANPHPKHIELNGREFDGLNVQSDGVTWFPGDHAGCECDGAMVLERTEG